MGSANRFFDIVQHPLRFRLFLLSKLPSAFFSGVRIKFADEHKAVATVPYKWFSTNPFKSTYFACLGMAAEMTTGILAMANIYGQDPPVSMLIIKSEASFLKKAKGITTFTCEEGLSIKQAVKEAMASGKVVTVSARSVGVDETGDVIAEFIFTWSFKAKTGVK